jgi:CDP-diacylglycerol--serine O-phosphatidyltransferase
MVRHRAASGGTVVLPTGERSAGLASATDHLRPRFPADQAEPGGLDGRTALDGPAGLSGQRRRRFRMRARTAGVNPRVLPPLNPALPPVGEETGRHGSTGGLSIPLLPGVRTRKRRLRFAAVNACTLASLLLGLSAIFLAMQKDVRWAAACLVGCVIFDGLDGALARRLGVVSPFGAQMDSLADMCSFGVAAPVVVYASIHHTAPTLLVAGACALVAACAAIRLARFNVSPKDGRFFCGVPTTMAAGVFGLATLIGLRLPGSIAIAAVVALGLAMVSGFPYARFDRILRLPPWVWVPPVVGAFIDYRVTFAALVLAYLASGPLIWLRARV